MTKQYRALKELYYPLNVVIQRRLKAGEKLTMKERGAQRIVQVGELTDDIPTMSIRGLLEAGWIEEVTDDKAQ